MAAKAAITGTAQHNLALSQLRAQAVAAQLVADGVPLSAISKHAYGAAHQLVPTLTGVAARQNRRVEIILGFEPNGS
jgi:outer membrane protein OmpA-like peptidoglycan-associated protein